MVLENDPIVFALWIGDALSSFLWAGLSLCLAALVVGYLIAAFRHGPLAAGDLTYKAVKNGLVDLASLSPRRIWALTRLALQEAIRRRVLAALAIFVLILTFAGWFLDPTTRDPGTLYLSFVMDWTRYLVLIMALFLSAFSLPADIKNHTIYTVVTKPVRASEIGRAETLRVIFLLFSTGYLKMRAHQAPVILRSSNGSIPGHHRQRLAPEHADDVLGGDLGARGAIHHEAEPAIDPDGPERVHGTLGRAEREDVEREHLDDPASPGRSLTQGAAAARNVIQTNLERIKLA
jgi:hypothetical protein